MTVQVTSDELLAIIGAKEAELHGLRRDNAELAKLASQLNARVAELEAQIADMTANPPLPVLNGIGAEG